MKNGWIITDDKVGTRAQAAALAAALNLRADIRTVELKAACRIFPATFLGRFSHIYKNEPEISGNPDLVIAAGRGAVPAALRMKRRGNKVIFIQNPYIDPARFDCVIAPEHDGMRGGNVISCLGALSKINADVLAEAARTWQARLAHFPQPRMAVLIGGNSSLYRLDEKTARNIARQLQDVHTAHGGSLLVTVSRRTGKKEKNILRAALRGENIFFHDGAGDNPYAGFLAYADVVFVTEDSVSMHCEAASTGKPVYTLGLKKKFLASLLGRGGKFRKFHAALQARGISRKFEGRLEKWNYEPLNEAMRVAELVKQKLGTI